MANRVLFVCLVLSLFLHLASMIVVEMVEVNQKKYESIEVDLLAAPPLVAVDPDSTITEDPLKTAQIVEQSEQRINEEVPKDARYLSRHNQEVLHETRAIQRGEFKNGGGAGNKPTVQKPSSSKRLTKAALPTLDALKPSMKWNQMTSADSVIVAPTEVVGDKRDADANPTHNQKDSQGFGASQSDDYLKDTEIGSQTLLSTREFVYYSYYSRIKQQLRQHWEPRIKEKIHKILRSGRRIASVESRITKVIITLDRSGTLIRVQVMGRSGIEDLDDAAVEAFRAAAPFPNPPKGIVDKDGTIKIRWNFVLEA